MRDASGAPLRIVTLPMPEPVHYDGTRLPASYANFYIGNAVVLVPVFGSPRDAVALATLRALFPGRRRSSASTPSTWSGASAPSTASPSSSRLNPG